MKRIKTYIFLSVLSVLLMATTCDDSTVHYTDFILENQSNETIYVCEYQLNDKELLTPLYVFRRLNKDFVKKVFTDGIFIGKVGIPWNSTQADDKYQIIIFKQSTMDKYTEDELVEKNIFDKRYMFTYDELKKMNFKITYTGE